MRKFIIFLLMFFLMFMGQSRADAKKLMELKIGKGEARVSRLQGFAQVIPAGKRTWSSLKAGDTLRGGDEVKTGTKSKLELIMADFTAVRFADNSHFKILQLEAGDGSALRNVRIHMAIGRGWANLSRVVNKRGQFDLACDNAVAGVRGTVYRMNVEGDKSALIRVYEGQVAVSGGVKDEARKQVFGPPQKTEGPKPVPGPKKVTMEEWTVIIKAMQQIRIASDGVAENPRDFTEQEDRDEWVDWNKLQDSELKSMTE